MVSIKMKEGRTTAKVAMTDPTTLPVEVKTVSLVGSFYFGSEYTKNCWIRETEALFYQNRASVWGK